MKACCGFGHRNLFENISERLDYVVESAIQQGCEIFYTGASKDFRVWSSLSPAFPKIAPYHRSLEKSREKAEEKRYCFPSAIFMFARTPWCKCGRYMRGRLLLLIGEVLQYGEGQED